MITVINPGGTKFTPNNAANKINFMERSDGISFFLTNKKYIFM
jgi:hypothetical protein